MLRFSTWALIALPIPSIAAADLINGDFETGDLSGWTLLDENGLHGVSPFDTTGDSFESLSAWFSLDSLAPASHPALYVDNVTLPEPSRLLLGLVALLASAAAARAVRTG